MLVLDGNLKNRRDVYSATDAGFIEYSSLPGANKSGCQLSPCATLKFCYYHAPRVSSPTETGTAMDGFTKIITAVHETRSGKHYQVSLYVHANVLTTEKVCWNSHYSKCATTAL